MFKIKWYIKNLTAKNNKPNATIVSEMNDIYGMTTNQVEQLETLPSDINEYCANTSNQESQVENDVLKKVT